MTKVIYNSKTPYATTPQDSFFLGYFQDRPIPADDTDIQILVESRHHNRPDVLAYDLYQNSAYSWVFMRMNMDLIKDPIRDLKEGMVIKVATLEKLKRLIG